VTGRGDGVLGPAAEAPDAEALSRARHVLGSQLQVIRVGDAAGPPPALPDHQLALWGPTISKAAGSVEDGFGLYLLPWAVISTFICSRRW
jgi:hypothetical protein